MQIIALLSIPVLLAAQSIQVVPVAPTPFPEQVAIRIVFPRGEQVERRQPVSVQVRLDGYPLGSASQFPRASILRDDPDGQPLRVIVDNDPYISFYQASEDSFDEDRSFYDKTITFKLPQHLDKGEHILRIFPTRSFGESIKAKKALKSRVFYIGEKTTNLDFNPKGPYLTYNEPQGSYSSSRSDPILLDFEVTNARLSADGFKVRLSVDGEEIETLTMWVPYYLYNVPKGSHEMRLELLDSKGKRVPGLFNDTTRQIKVN